MRPRRRQPQFALPGARRRGGFTLLELLMSAAILAVLSVAMGSAVLIASRAIRRDASDTSAARSVLATDVLEQLRSDLRTATSFSERQSSAVTFSVPDRNSDGVQETIRYEWSGVPGAPLTRAYNGSLPEILADDVRAFTLDYFLQSLKPSMHEGDEVLLMSHIDAPGGTMKPFLVDIRAAAAQYFKPLLPPNAVAWKVTRVQLMGRCDKTLDGIIYFTVMAANNSLKPSFPTYETVQVSESQIPAATSWFDVSFSNLEGLDPSQGICLVISCRSGTANVALIQYEEKGEPMTPGTHWMSSNDGGITFTNPEQTRDMCFRLYGTITTEGR